MKFTSVVFIACLMFNCHGERQANTGNAGKPAGARRPEQENTVAAVPATARVVETFGRIKPEMTMREVVKICGLPDGDVGSGIHVYVYKLADGSVVHIGTPDQERLLYVVHVQAGGRRRDLLRNTPK